jgi:hypothetical protein
MKYEQLDLDKFLQKQKLCMWQNTVDNENIYSRLNPVWTPSAAAISSIQIKYDLYCT